mgnify:CR=1 FL=1
MIFVVFYADGDYDLILQMNLQFGGEGLAVVFHPSQVRGIQRQGDLPLRLEVAVGDCFVYQLVGHQIQMLSLENITLDQIDAVETVNQALGEFGDKLATVNLTPIFRHPESPVMLQADGRLLWRILSNILSNAVKYALPDTRLYVDLMTLQGNAVLAIKNISREQLNVNAEELMERFVRGDASRNTEGSGLGLNIAKSLVELQKGQMHLMVDGDLFKVTLILPLV